MPHSHYTKHKIRKRHLMDRLLTGILGAAVCLLCVVFYYRYAVYSQSVMSESVSASEYYEKQYDRFSEELRLFLGAIGVPEAIAGNEEELRAWYSFELRKKVLTEDRAGAFSASIYERIEKPVRNYLAEEQIVLSAEAEAGFRNMLSSLESNLKDEIDHPDIRQWYAERDAFEGHSGPAVLLSGAAAAVAVLILFLIQHYRYRAVYYTGAGLCLGGAAGALCVLLNDLSLRGRSVAATTLNAALIYAGKISTAGFMIAAAFFALGLMLLVLERVFRQKRDV